MPIFGDFAELPFPEVLAMLGQRGGCLLIGPLPKYGRIELYLQQETLHAIKVNGRFVGDIMQIKYLFGELISAPNGEFEFAKVEPTQMPNHFELPLQRLVLSSTTLIDEIGHYRAQFAHPQTQFVLSGSPNLWLETGLVEFFQQAQPFLTQGCNAEDLAKHLGMSVDQVQLSLYKLRALGRIAPRRAFEQNVQQQKPETVAAPQHQTSDRKSVV